MKLCGANMKQKKDVHLVNIVTINRREYIVDVGYAAPFLQPLPRNLQNKHTIEFGFDKYILHPMDASKYSRLDLYRNGKLTHGYQVNPKSRNINEFDRIVKDSFRLDSTFMNSLLLVYFNMYYSQVINNMTYLEISNSQVKKISINTFNDLIHKIEEIFLMPGDISKVAMEGVELTQNPWS